MKKLDLDKLAQPYVGRTDDYVQAIFPRATTAELADPTALVNLVGKYAGRMVYDTTLGQPVWATDDVPASAWATAGPAGDPLWNNVVILADFEGEDNDITYTTVDQYAQSVTFIGAGDISVAVAAPVTGSTTILNNLGAGAGCTVPHNARQNLGAGDFCIEGWTYYLGDPDAQDYKVCGKWATGNREWGIQFTSGPSKLNFIYSTDGSNLLLVGVPCDLTTNTWYHIAVTRSGNDVRFFVDGVQFGTTQTLSATLFASTRVIEIGLFDGSGGLQGYTDQFRMTVGAARYTSNFTKPTEAFPTS